MSFGITNVIIKYNFFGIQDSMDILYDHQAFRTGRFSGIPRYFGELILQYKIDVGITPILPEFWTINQDYRNLRVCEQNITWDVRDKVVSLAQHYFHQNPSRLLDGAERKTIQLLEKQEFDVFHPTRLEPYFLKHIGKKPYVLTIHDLTYEKYPEYFPLSTKVRENTRNVVKHASQFIADSENTKLDFIQYYDVDYDLVNVIYLGSLFEKYQIPHTDDPIEVIETKYLLYVGERSPHKNIYHFILAIRSLLKEGGCRLICVGGGPFRPDEIKYLQALGVNDVVSQETVSDQKLIHLYQHALAFVFPSMNEGFGLPILEAFSCGCPVICSGTSCLPEIGGDAAIYFDPKDAVSIMHAVNMLIDDGDVRRKMIIKGYEQLAKFSWKKCADETKKVYEKVLEG